MIKTPIGEYAIIRGVPNTYDQCIKSHKFENTINVGLAKEQHAQYAEILKQVDLTLIPVNSNEKFPDCCFVEDTAVVIRDKAIISNMAAKSRIGEETEVENSLSNYKAICKIDPPGTIDGGDVLRIDEKIYIGLSKRTNRPAIQQLNNFVSDYGCQMIPIRIKDVLHLKSACTYLGNDYIIMCSGHFDENVFSEYRKIVIPKGEAHDANFLSINGKVLVQKDSPVTKGLIENEGFETVEIEVSEFRKGGGSLTCLSIIF